MSDSELGWLANLSGSAAKLLLYALLSGTVDGRVADVMRLSGVTSRPAFFKAKGDLYEQGLVDHKGRPVLTGSKNEPRETDTGSKNEPAETPTVYSGSKNEPVAGSENEPDETDPPGWQEQAEDIDSWPSDGKPGQRGTNWQKRRDAQVKLLCMAWPSYFRDTSPLTTQMAKQYLSLAGDSSSEVISLFLYASEVRNVHGDGSKGYILTALKRRKEEGPRQPVPLPVRPKVDDDGLEDDPAFVEQLRQLQSLGPSLGWEDD